MRSPVIVIEYTHYWGLKSFWEAKDSYMQENHLQHQTKPLTHDTMSYYDNYYGGLGSGYGCRCGSFCTRGYGCAYGGYGSGWCCPWFYGGYGFSRFYWKLTDPQTLSIPMLLPMCFSDVNTLLDVNKIAIIYWLHAPTGASHSFLWKNLKTFHWIRISPLII